MKLPKIPIDYSKAGTGEAPFDGKHVILHINSGYDIKIVEAYFYYPLTVTGRWAVIGGSIENEEATHYTPMPEFVEISPEITMSDERMDRLRNEDKLRNITFPKFEEKE